MDTLEEHNNRIIMGRKYTKENRAGVACPNCRTAQRGRTELIYVDISIKKGEAPPKLKDVVCPICDFESQKMMEDQS